MYELINVRNNTYYFECPAKVGLYKLSDTDVCLIDSGSDKDAAKKIKKEIDAQGWSVRYIVNTHSHADHIGGNAYFQQNTDCKIFASGVEADFANHPILEPTFLFGANPYSALKHKFLLAKESCVYDITDSEFPKDLEIIPLPGHSFSMIGIRTRDDVVFPADAVASKSTLGKYKVSFSTDISNCLKTLESLKALKAFAYVPSHTEVVKDITELCDINIASVNSICNDILDILKTPMCIDMLIKEIFTQYNLTMTEQQYVLVGSTLRSYLTYLSDLGKLEYFTQDNILLWKTV